MKTQLASPWPVIDEFRRALQEAYGERLKGIVIYGSLARGEWTPDSDIDVLVLLDSTIDAKAERERVWNLAWELNRRYEELLSVLVFTEEEFQRGRSPLFFNVRREGWFMTPEDQPTAVQELLQRAQEALEDARRILEWGGANSAVSRGYYAMFNAAQAALLSKGITRSRHKGLHAAFGYHFVRTGQFPAQLHRALEAAYDKRLIADYSPQSVPLEEAEALIKDAEAFLRAIDKLLGEEAP